MLSLQPEPEAHDILKLETVRSPNIGHLTFPFSNSWFFRDIKKQTKIKLRLKILSFYLYRVTDIFKRISAGPSSAR